MPRIKESYHQICSVGIKDNHKVSFKSHTNWSACWQLAKLEQTIKHWAVFTNIDCEQRNVTIEVLKKNSKIMSARG